MPKVSILVPVYNVERFLKECIESILNQTLNDIEIICVNDGSTDNSLNILREYAVRDNRIKVIDKLNTGYGHSMNVGLDEAVGDYVGIVESDDFALPEMFETLYNAAYKNTAEIVKSNYIAYKGGDGKKKDFVEVLNGCSYNHIFSPKEEQQIFHVETHSIWSGIYKRDFLERNHIRFNETKGASYQDVSFAFQVFACAERVLFLKDAFLCYRIDNNNSSVKSTGKVFCICDEYKVIDEFLLRHPLQKQKLDFVKTVMKYREYRANYNRISSKFQYAFLLRMVEEFRSDDMQGLLQEKHWNITEWKEMQNLIHNPEQFFYDTVRDFCEERLISYPVLNFAMYRQGFWDYINKHQKIIIYGAGIIGKRVAQYLMSKKAKTNIICFAVSDLEGNSKAIFEIPVYCIEDLKAHAKDSIVLVSTKEQVQVDIIQGLTNLGFHNIVSMDSKMIKVLEIENQ